MVDFFYNNFYEVLSGEGIWVLILIGCGLAVASFILLTMKIEVNPKANKLNNIVQNVKKEENSIQDKNNKKKFSINLNSKAKEKKNKGKEANAAGAVTPMPVRPEVVQPDMAGEENTEQVYVEMTDPDGFDIPALPEMEDQASPLDDAAGLEPQEDLQAEAEMSLDTMEESEEETAEEESADGEKSEEGEKNEKAKGDGDSSSIFDIFNEVEEEESGIAEIAKNMEDVTINGLLSDTETLSEELKNIFTKYRRA
jgi:type IV secretory pathway VirB10-like protein